MIVHHVNSYLKYNFIIPKSVLMNFGICVREVSVITALNYLMFLLEPRTSLNADNNMMQTRQCTSSPRS